MSDASQVDLIEVGPGNSTPPLLAIIRRQSGKQVGLLGFHDQNDWRVVASDDDAPWATYQDALRQARSKYPNGGGTTTP
jgi:hypothetical protein